MSHMDIANRIIRRHEGSVTRAGTHRAYDDGDGGIIIPGKVMLGHVSAGYGRNLETRGLSEAEAGMLLANDLAIAERIAAAFAGSAWSEVSDVRRAALIDMAHTLGPGGMMAFKHMQLAVRALDWEAAADQALDSLWAREQAPDRAHDIALMLMTGAEAPDA